ncbi:hypothetical protein QUW07_09085, partial [[Clostridium] symbiosum]|nr:hypothetical protein [[Clostridium] symbiosum]
MFEPSKSHQQEIGSQARRRLWYALLLDIRVFYCFEYHTIIQQIHQSFVPGRYAGDTAFNR